MEVIILIIDAMVVQLGTGLHNVANVEQLDFQRLLKYSPFTY
jgi:hypothetical protein